jgi:hypothetical protein
MLWASQKQSGTSTGFDVLDCCTFRVTEYLQSGHNVVDDSSDLISATDRSRSGNAGAIYPTEVSQLHRVAASELTSYNRIPSKRPYSGAACIEF